MANGDVDAAAAAAERADAAKTAHEDLEVLVTLALSRARTLAATGRAVEAKAVALEARSVIESKGAAIEAPAAREGFLRRNVPIAEMMAFADALLGPRRA